jgi:hypothetical protein
MEGRRSDTKKSDYDPPLDRECGVMYVLETKEEVRRFVAADRERPRETRKS